MSDNVWILQAILDSQLAATRSLEAAIRGVPNLGLVIPNWRRNRQPRPLDRRFRRRPSWTPGGGCPARDLGANAGKVASARGRATLCPAERHRPLSAGRSRRMDCGTPEVCRSSDAERLHTIGEACDFLALPLLEFMD